MKKIVKKLYDSSNIDIFFSGTTLNLVYIKNNVIYVCNIGDSRAILAQGKDFENVFALSEDHKPEIEKEKTWI